MKLTRRTTKGLLLSGALLACAVQPALAQNTYSVGVAYGPPPPALHEHIPPKPSTSVVWRSGYWHWDGNRYVWVHGDYARPPRPWAFWIPEHYVRGVNDEWRLAEGRWTASPGS
jgi:hypothetical protein